MFLVNKDFDNNFLMQAASHTSGIYLKSNTTQDKSTVAFFGSAFSTLLESRERFKCPHFSRVSNTSLCNCCNRSITYGFACSNCLKIACERPRSDQECCQFCGVRFGIFSAKMLTRGD